jgi:hypothetical protein
MKNEFAKPCVHCSPTTPPHRSIVEPILTLSRSEVLRVASSRSDATPLALQFRCRMCSRTWSHRVDVRFMGDGPTLARIAR